MRLRMCAPLCVNTRSAAGGLEPQLCAHVMRALPLIANELRQPGVGVRLKAQSRVSSDSSKILTKALKALCVLRNSRLQVWWRNALLKSQLS